MNLNNSIFNAETDVPDINIKEIDYVCTQHLNHSWSHNPPKLQYHHLCITTDGEAIIHVNNRKYIHSTNAILYAPKGSYYRSQSGSKEFGHTTISFDVYDDENFNYNFNTLYNVGNPEKYITLFNNAQKEWDRKDFCYKIKTKMILMDILKNLYFDSLDKNKFLYGYNTIKESIKYMEKNYLHGNIEVQELADMSEISRNHFIRIFKNIYNTTPTKYMNKLRIEKSLEFLEHSNMSIYEIAREVGFSNQYYFSKMFKSFVGISPLQYRSQQG